MLDGRMGMVESQWSGILASEWVVRRGWRSEETPLNSLLDMCVYVCIYLSIWSSMGGVVCERERASRMKPWNVFAGRFPGKSDRIFIDAKLAISSAGDDSWIMHQPRGQSSSKFIRPTASLSLTPRFTRPSLPIETHPPIPDICFSYFSTATYILATWKPKRERLLCPPFMISCMCVAWIWWRNVLLKSCGNFHVCYSE